MAFDISIELGCGETAAELITLQLGHVDPVGGKTAHRLVERRRHVAHPEDETGNYRTRSCGRHICFARQRQKARGVVVLILYIGRQDSQPIEIGSQPWSKCSNSWVTGFGNFARGTGGVIGNDGAPAVLAYESATLTKCMGMTAHNFDVLHAGTWHCHQLEVNRHEVFADDVQV